MKVGRFNFDHKFYLCLVFGLSFALTTPLIHGLGYTSPGFFARAFYTLLFLLAYTLIHLYPFLAAVIPAILAALAFFYLRNAPSVPPKLSSLFVSPQPAGAIFWPLVTMAAVSLALYILIFRAHKPLLPLFLAGLVTFVPLWYLRVDTAYPAAVAYSGCWLMLLSYKRGSDFWNTLPPGEQERGREMAVAEVRRGWIGYTALILFITLLLTLILPKDFAPVPWRSLHNWANENFSFLRRLRGREQLDIRGDGGEFTFYAFGFQEGIDLGGPLWSDDTVLLEVSGRGGLYLKGSVCDCYTGRSWTNTATSMAPASFPAPVRPLPEYLSEVTLTIKHRRMRTRSVFSMLYPLEVSGLPGSLQMDENSGLVLSRSVPLKYEYTVRGLYPAYRCDFAALEIETEGEPAGASYLALPAALPSRVRRLAGEITGDLPGNYEKLKALETYLRRHYRYNPQIPFLPEGRDFVDFFLFDLREGYCTSFATALAVMGRAAGVPTRYVMGFKVPQRPARDRVYRVAGSDAHAWVEGYIPGVGWLPFEATPGFSTGDALPLRRAEVDFANAAAGEDNGITAPINGRDNTGPHDDYPYYYFPGGSETRARVFFARLMQVLLAAGPAALLFMAASILCRLRRIKIFLRQIDRQAVRRRAVSYYNLSLSLLERIALGRYPGETPREFSRRIIRDVHAWTLDFGEISEGINLALYSKQEIPAGLADQAGQFFRYIFDCYLSQVGKWTAFNEILLQGRYFSPFPLGKHG